MGNSTQNVIIPQDKEYGWELNESGVLKYKITRKAVLNRITFIANLRGATVENSTKGFVINRSGALTDLDINQIKEEMLSLGAVEVPDDVSMNKSGREEPNFQK